jgi:hypothetical protein
MTLRKRVIENTKKSLKKLLSNSDDKKKSCWKDTVKDKKSLQNIS